MEKKLELKKYNIDDFYYAIVDDEPTIVRETENGYVTFYHYETIYNVDQTTTISKKNVKIISSLKQVLKDEQKVLLIGDNGKEKKQIFEKEAIMIYLSVLNSKNISKDELNNIRHLSYKATNIVCDLLGINVTCNPNFGLAKKRHIYESVIPASRVIILKKTIWDYITVSLLNDKNVKISNYKDGRDYRISRSLNRAGIVVNEKMKKNIFQFSVDINGNMTIDGINIDNGENEFRNKIMLKKA